MRRYFLFSILIVSLSLALSAQGRYRTVEGSAFFRSDAPLELIEARSAQLQGIIDPANQQFAFSVPIRSFEGFNSPLQREHFNENYLESPRFPKATFSGRIIEPVDFSKDGDYTVRAKGKLTIHGIERERIIRGKLRVRGDRLELESDFSVLLSEHDIAIPNLVYQKIAEEILVQIRAAFSFSPS